MSSGAKKICMSPRNVSMNLLCSEQCDFNSGDFKDQHLGRIYNYQLRKYPTELIVQEEDIDMFLQLLDEDMVIQEFMKNDRCLQLADRYLLAMVFTYFKRAQYSTMEFTRYNFFVALFLAHDLEEDDEDMKCELYIWALGNHWQQHFRQMLDSREALWKAMDHRGIVMALRPNHPAWQRHRPLIHAGAARSYAEITISDCYHCNKLKSLEETHDSGMYESSDETESCYSDTSRVAESSLSSIDVCDIFLNDSLPRDHLLRRLM
ncbi:hypothetical protein C0J52_08406 [Blattella germanica]|nr:hypothetical protein C0J52_08406 [Blattella germanica]